ncbi:DMT family transporter [Fictibacillus barbaricus]|uniref:Transporter family-2 protein n=1 Tax=Fictibacillus barbaricus TaxID=182136 RepID=A0ABU1U0V8_9BACL|nr:DMT family transporter [Fictibacillus barbaricus]MDR7073105.1 transporter family-2 protein [Fictibacillus barbaricus]
MIIGLLLSLIAGALVCLQNIFNSKVNQKAGSMTTTALVLFLGFAASLLMGLFLEGKDIFTLHHMKFWYWGCGILGVGVVFCLTNAIRLLGPTYAISISLTSQLGFALLWDSLGWFGLVQVPFTWKQLLGVLIIAAGIFVFKLSGMRSKHSIVKDHLHVSKVSQTS